MTNQPETTLGQANLTGDSPVEHPKYQTGIGITQWLAVGLVAFSILMVLLAIVANLFLGSPGG